MKTRQNIAMALGALKANLFTKNTPLSVMLSLTNRCTSKCSYCDIPLRKQNEMSTAQLLKLIEEMSKAGVQKLSLWGGEPLLRGDIGELIGCAKEKGMCVSIDSNGDLIPERFEEIKDLDFIILSFDGEKDLHDKNRNSGSYDNFFRAVKFIDGKIPIWTLTVLTRHNINSADFIVKKAKEFNFQALFQVPYHPPQIGSGNDVQASQEEYRQAFSHLLRLKTQGAPIISSMHYLEAVSRWGLFPQTTSKSYFPGFPKCWAGKLFCNIDTNGDMYACSPMIGRIEKAPNVLKEGFAQSFEKLKDQHCRSCLSACCLEANFVFSFDWLSVLEWWKII
jgi:MoaA/NifB/PqqE/SkfB family radical SAM enzyme